MNRLANESSPYLRQHAHNPVDWYPWGPEALERAKREDKPIFLSIGYAACHWCHVMEHESFANAAIAQVMNEGFVSIKVDREERPDLDEIYMAATVAFTGGHGGWPMSVFLTPELQPFYAGTYFPPEDRWGHPSFERVLQHVSTLWRDRRADVERAAGGLVKAVGQQLAPVLEPGEPTWDIADAVAASSVERFDDRHGGFGQPPHYAPKFPHASELRVLALQHARTGDAQLLAMVEQTLTGMAEGGMYDQVGGGFHRYSTDRMWLVPHFEKMLYDNAQLVPLYLEAHALTGKAFYADIARDVLRYLRREMIDPQGGFWSTQDADSEGEEGKFFVWDKAEIEAALGDAASLFCARFGVTAAGNFEGKNVLFVARDVAAAAGEAGADVASAPARLSAARDELLTVRSRRVAPRTDDKVLASWNGLAISAFAEAYLRLGNVEDLRGAQGAADFVLREMLVDGRLLRTWRQGQAKLMGYLEDYAFVADGLLTLFEADADPRWLAAAGDLLAAVRTHFVDAHDGNFFFTADDHEQLVARSKSMAESSTPAAGAVAAQAFLRLGLLRGDPSLYEIGARALRTNHAYLERMPAACPSLVLAALWHLAEPRELVVVGPPGDAATEALLATARRAFPRHHVLVHVHDGNRQALAQVTSLVEGKVMVDGRPAVYVCRGGVCARPLTDPESLAQALR
ncbi:MAG: thioredoxin domain-containing protein [Planctomycetota bacterium]